MTITQAEETVPRALQNIQNAYEVRQNNGLKTMLSASSILYEGEQHTLMSEMLEVNVKPFVM